jgi:ferrous iron transport protein A
MSLAAIPSAGRCRVKGVRLEHALSRRLMEMGLVEGTEVEVIRRAPLGDPLQIRVGDFDLSLRASEARLIDVASL